MVLEIILIFKIPCNRFELKKMKLNLSLSAVAVVLSMLLIATPSSVDGLPARRSRKATKSSRKAVARNTRARAQRGGSAKYNFKVLVGNPTPVDDSPTSEPVESEPVTEDPSAEVSE